MPPSSQALPASSARTHAGFRWIATGLGVCHLLLVLLLHQLRVEHVIADGLLIVLPWIGPRALAFAKVVLPAWLAGVLLDEQGLLPHFGHIHTGDVHALALELFPGPSGLTWPEWFHVHTHAVLDLLCGGAYAVFLYEFLVVAVLLFFWNRKRCEALTWAFLAVNLLAVIIQAFWPVAPPWYLIHHGLGPANPHALPSPAGTARFDALLGIHYFQDFYARNSFVFGSMPSTHVTYPLLVAWFTWERGLKWRIPTVAFTALVCFSAVYLGHHRVMDVLVGLALACISAMLGAWGVARAGRRAAAQPEPEAIAVASSAG